MFTPVTNVSSTAPSTANSSVSASSSAQKGASEAPSMPPSAAAEFTVNTGGRTSPITHSTSSGRPLPQGEALRSLIQDRQREVSELHALEVAGLEKQLQEQQAALEDAAKQQKTLAADFAFNLTLIAERDAELSAFETAFQDLRQELHARDGALSASLQQCASLQEALAAAEQQAAARQHSERVRAKQARQQVEDAKWAGDAAARSERDKAEAARQDLAAALEERDSLVARERAEATAAFEVKLKSWEADSRRRESELSAALRACETRAQEACRQRDSQAAAATSAEARVQALQESAHEAEALNRQRAWDHDEALRSSQQEVEALTKKLGEVEAGSARSTEALERRLRDAQHAAAMAQRQAATSKASHEEQVAHAAAAHHELSTALKHAEERARDVESRAQAAEDTLSKVEAKLSLHMEAATKASKEVARLTVLVDTTTAARDALSTQLATAVAQALANAEATAAKTQAATREAVAAAQDEWKRDAEAAAAQATKQWTTQLETQAAELNNARAERDSALEEAARFKSAIEARPPPLQRLEDQSAPNPSSWSMPPTPSPLQLQEEERQDVRQEQPGSFEQSCDEHSDSFMPAVSPPRLSSAFESPLRAQSSNRNDNEQRVSTNGSNKRDEIEGGDSHTARLEEENRRLAAAVGAMRRELLDLHKTHAASTGHATNGADSPHTQRREEEIAALGRRVEEQFRRADAAEANAAALRAQVQTLEAKLAEEAKAAAGERARLMQASNRLRGQVALLEAQKGSSNDSSEGNSKDQTGGRAESSSSSCSISSNNNGNDGGGDKKSASDAIALAARAAALEAALWEVAAENKTLRKDLRRARANAAGATTATAVAPHMNATAEVAAATGPASASTATRIDLPQHSIVPELRTDLMKPALRGLFVAPKRRVGSSGSNDCDTGNEGAGNEDGNDDNDDGNGDGTDREGSQATLVASLDGTAIVSALMRDAPAARLLLGDAVGSTWNDSSGHSNNRGSSGSKNSSDALAAHARAVVSALGIPELAGLGHSSRGKASSSSSSVGVDVAELTALWAAWAVLPKGGLRAAVAAYARHFPVGIGSVASNNSSGGGGGGSGGWNRVGERNSRSQQSTLPLPPPPPMAAPAVALAVAGYNNTSGRPPAAPDRSASGRTLESQRRGVAATGTQSRGGNSSRGSGSSGSGARPKEAVSSAAADDATAAAVARVRNYNDLRHESAAKHAEGPHMHTNTGQSHADETGHGYR